jgi:hypothetical protein
VSRGSSFRPVFLTAGPFRSGNDAARPPPRRMLKWMDTGICNRSCEPSPCTCSGTQASPACPEATPELEAFISTHVDYLGSLLIFEPGRLRCSLSSSILAPGKPVSSASTVASLSTASPARSPPDVARDCRCHRDVRPAESRGGKTEMLASSSPYAAVTCELRGQPRPVRRIRTSASTRRSAPAVCAPFASRSSRVSTGRFSVASVSTRETVADPLHPNPSTLHQFPLSQRTGPGTRDAGGGRG